MRTLILSVESNDGAELIAKELAQRMGLDPYNRGEDGDGDLTDEELISAILGYGTTLDAMVARPTLACKCTSIRQAGKMSKTVPYGQVPRFKWWVHKPCKRPAAYAVTHFISNMLNGHRDLLSEIVPNHVEVTDHLDRGARQEVNMFRARQRR